MSMRMNRRLATAGFAVMLFSQLASSQQLQVEYLSGHEVAAREVLIKPRPAVLNALQQLIQNFDADLAREIGHAGVIRLRSRSMGAAALLNALSQSSLVSSAEPNYIIRAVETPANDTYFGSLWGLRNTGQTISGQVGVSLADIRAATAWDTTTGSSSIVVGVVDSGVDYSHPDLAANIWTAQTPYQIKVGSTTVNCPAGSHGFNAISLTCAPSDDNMHGTHVSGTIGARGNNLNGVTGVNWQTSIVGLKMLNSSGSGSNADAINAIEAAVQLKAQGVNIRVLNASWGGGSFSSALLQAINDAAANDILFVAAAGNNGQNNGSSPFYPASYNASNVIAVAATDNQDNLASFSNYGIAAVHLGAPGVDIISTTPGGNYTYLSGTSMATPHVTGAAALVLSACSLTTDALKAAILNSVDPIASLTTKTMTGGRLNVLKTLVSCGAASATDFSLSASPFSVSVLTGGSTQTTITVGSLSGFNGIVNLTASGMPSGVSASFSPSSVTGSGTSTLSLTASTAAAVGTYAITVRGTSGSLVHTATVNLTVSVPDFTISASPTSVSIVAGNSIISTITVGGLPGFSGTVNLAASGMPSGVTASFSATSIATSGTSILTLSSAANTAWGTYPIAIQGTSGVSVHTVAVNLTVNAPPDFTISASPASLSVSSGSSTTSAISIGSLFGFSDVVNLTASGMPSGVTASFSPTSIAGAGGSTLTLTATAAAPGGSYPISVRGTAGSLVHSATVNLGIVSLPAILLPASLTVDPGGQAVVLVTLSAPAPAGGVFVSLTSSNASVATWNSGSTFIPEGQTSTTRPRINGGNAGSATMTASAAGFVSGSSPVQVGSAPSGTMSFSPASLTINAPGTQNLTLSLSSPAAAGGVTVALTSSNASVATVPPSATIGPNGTTATVTVTGVAGGSATITASALPAYTGASAAVTVVSQLTVATASLTNGRVGTPYSQALGATGGTPPYTWTLTSGTLPAGLLPLTTSGQISGTPTAAITNTPLTFRVTDSSSPVQIATRSLTLTILPAAVAASITATGGTPQSASIGTAFAAPLAATVKDSGGNPLNGVSVTFSTPGSGPSASFTGGGTTYTTSTNSAGVATTPTFTANSVAGGYTVTASVSGVATPASFSLTNTSGPAIQVPASVTVDSGAQAPFTLTLLAPAPAGGVFVTLSSSNSSVATLNLSSTFIPEGQTMSSRPRITGISPGTAIVTVVADGYAPATALVQVR